MELKLNTEKTKHIIRSSTTSLGIVCEDIEMIDIFCFWGSTILKASLEDLKDRLGIDHLGKCLGFNTNPMACNQSGRQFDIL